MKDADWYKEEVAKLKVIVQQHPGKIARSYLIEKLTNILDESGISIHPALKHKVTEILKGSD